MSNNMSPAASAAPRRLRALAFASTSAPRLNRPSAPEADLILNCIKGFPDDFARDWGPDPHFRPVRLFAHNRAPRPLCRPGATQRFAPSSAFALGA
jgi:hypothetical protein